jgi:hypothetical protein
LDDFRALSPSSLPKVLYYTHTRNLGAVHLALADSYQIYTASLPDHIFSQEVLTQDTRIPKNVQQALSSSFVDEWGPAIDRENAAFQKYDCFAAVPLPPGARPLRGLWVLTRTRGGAPKLDSVGGDIANSLAAISFLTIIIVQFSLVGTIESCWLLPLLKITLYVKQMLCKPFCMVSWMMLTFTSIICLVSRVLLG